jgi:hypothetical protein
MNICRLSEEAAFSLAYKMAAENPDTTAYYRFADFENYYPRRMKTDEHLYHQFTSMGGKPKEKHPLFFVLQGSSFLDGWFGNGSKFEIMLKHIPSEAISFTLGDSNAILYPMRSREKGNLTMYSKEELISILRDYGGFIDHYMNQIAETCKYIEVQLWDDDYCTAQY